MEFSVFPDSRWVDCVPIILMANNELIQLNLFNFHRSCRECAAETPPSCWPFGKVKGKMRRQRTCNF